MECESSEASWETRRKLTHAIGRYHWNIFKLCQLRWENYGGLSIDDGHKVYSSGKEDRYEYGGCYFAQKDMVSAV